MVELMRLRTVLAALILLLAAGLARAEQVVISINKTNQSMTVSVDGQELYVWSVSTGTAGYATPSGTYRPFRMEEYHFSEEWDDAPMPNSIFFTPQGHAIHGTEHVDSLGRRASHGCVRLAPDDAVTLFYMVEEAGMANTTVIVAGGVAKRSNRQRGRRWMRSPDWMFDDSEGY
jgi:lipoprotein-anchoring transpeptidase ErfK/SrfK